MMSFSSELNNALEKISAAQKEFLNYLRTIKPKSKEQLMLEHYQQTLSKHSPWLIATEESNKIDQNEKKSIGPINVNLRISQLIENLAKNPHQKKELITYFLMEFNVINENDRRVLAENFANLPPEQLKKELNDLCGLFSACE
jgi:hypothetical protein